MEIALLIGESQTIGKQSDLRTSNLANVNLNNRGTVLLLQRLKYSINWNYSQVIEILKIYGIIIIDYDSFLLYNTNNMRGKDMENNYNGDPGKDQEVTIDEDKKEERLFTQEEVNKILKDRLSRAKHTQANIDDRETLLAKREQKLNEQQAQLSDREKKLECKEYLQHKGYDASLIDVLDTSDIDAFKEKADKVVQINSSANHMSFIGSSEPTITKKAESDDVGFSRSYKHKPKEYIPSLWEED